MSFLSTAAGRLAHLANRDGNAMDIMVKDPSAGNETHARVIYTDLDGFQTTQTFGDLRSAVTYGEQIGAYWEAIHEANQCDNATKKIVLQDILDTMKLQVARYGQDFLPRDIKNAMHEIEEWLKISVRILPASQLVGDPHVFRVASGMTMPALIALVATHYQVEGLPYLQWTIPNEWSCSGH